jgi:ferredoxin
MSRVVIDWLRCDAHGVCAEVAPEVFGLDDWGYPMLVEAELDGDRERLARRAAAACPAIALRLARS